MERQPVCLVGDNLHVYMTSSTSSKKTHVFPFLNVQLHKVKGTSEPKCIFLQKNMIIVTIVCLKYLYFVVYNRMFECLMALGRENKTEISV